MQKSNLFALSAITMACAMAVSGMAQAAEAEQAKDEKVHQLQAVQVDDVYERTGEITIGENELKMQPSANHSINDAFRAESSVQFDINSRNGNLGAEIVPPQISIRGSRPYENSYLINGMSNNNNISPNNWAHHDGGMGNDAPTGDTQGIMITTDLVDNVKLLSENVSAEYGDFTGGVIDARIRDARADRWHVKAWTRHTRDAWAKQHFEPGSDAAELEYPTATDAVQKEFQKTTVGVTFDGPLMDGKLGALVSYQKVYSKTPQWQTFGAPATQREYWQRRKSTRDLENFIVRLNTDPANDFYVSGTVMYAPYEAEMFGPKVKDLHYKHQGGGWNVTLNTRANLSIGTWTNDFGWNQSEATSEQDTNELFYLPKGSVDWAPATVAPQHGGFGNYSREQDTWNYKSILALNPVDFAGMSHTVRLGAEVLYREATKSHGGHTLYNGTPKKVVGHTGSTDGVYGDYVYTQKTVYVPYETNTDYTTASAFLEDTVKVDRFTVRPGVRVSYDDITEDINIAPRFKFDADILADGRYHFNAGYNRYYGNQILDYALRSKNEQQKYKRTVSGTDVPGFSANGSPIYSSATYVLDDLDTPYSDEFVLGLTAKVMDTKFGLQGVYRDYADQLQPKEVIKSGKQLWTMENTGKSEYKGLTFTMEKRFELGHFGKHVSEFGVTRSELETNSRNLMDWAMIDNIEMVDGRTPYHYNTEYVYYNGSKKAYGDVPAGNFNSDWVLTYNHSASFMDDRLRASLWMRWESAADRLVKLSDVKNGQEWFLNFETRENEDLFNADLSLAYDLIKTANSTLTVTMDVTNLFDNKMFGSSSWRASDEGSYSMGRQFFLGMSYEY